MGGYWAWGAVIAAIVLGILVLMRFLRGRGRGPEPADEEPTEEVAEHNSINVA